jgi:predicted MFS family arabinose efflux permease
MREVDRGRPGAQVSAAGGPAGDGGVPASRALTPVLVFVALMSTVIASLGAPLLPVIERHYHVSLAASQWGLTITLLAGAVATPVLGRLGDGRHRRTVILAVIALTAVGCAVAALPFGFGVLLVGRALQGGALGLASLVTAVAREHLAGERRRRTIAILGSMTAAGVGLGYPVVAAIAQYLGLSAAFVAGALFAAAAFIAGIVVLPPGPARQTAADVPGAVLLGFAASGLLLYFAMGRWSSLLWLALASAAALAGWVMVELRTARPLVDLRLLRHRAVLAANVTGLLLAVGFYPISVLLVRLVLTPHAAGYGFGATTVVAGLMLTPYSLASLLGSRVAIRVAARTSAELVVVASSLVLVAALTLFAVDRDGYLPLVMASGLTGFGVGCAWAVNPLQIASGVPASETGSAMSFYMVTRMIGYSLGSTLSATVLAAHQASGAPWPPGAAYADAAWICVALLTAACLAAVTFTRRPGTAQAPPAVL